MYRDFMNVPPADVVERIPAPPRSSPFHRETPPARILLADLFGNDHPVELEIGCGKGKFLVACAEQFPERNFLGIDRISKWMKAGQTKKEKRNLLNLRFEKAEIRAFLQAIDPESVAVFHIYFPDPWPKRRHRKRRLITAEFLTLLCARLKSSGFLSMATDDPDYFSQIKKVSAEAAGFQTIRESVGRRLAHPESKTNYELKYEAAGRPIYYLDIQKYGGDQKEGPGILR